MDKTSFEAVIGLEVHIQLLTRSKAFCSDATTFGAMPNTQTGIVSLAHPGTLPKANVKHIELALRLGLALECSISDRTYFDRKHYFYADLPKGFQTTQDKQPICVGGVFKIGSGENRRAIRIHHIHMEEDAGKSMHEPESDASLIDYNRAGVPLLELVTEPDLRTSAEVFEFINKLRQLVRYLKVSDGNMEEGSLRADCNVSIRPVGSTELNTRCEIKNVNSARYAAKAVDYEIERQLKLVVKGRDVEQQTREYIPSENKTLPLRGKEEAHDYRYFPEPDLPPIFIPAEELARIKESLPILPNVWFRRFQAEYQLSDYDAELLVEQRPVAEMFHDFCSSHPAVVPTSFSKLVINKILPFCKETGISVRDFPILDQNIVDFLSLINRDEISSSVAYQKLWPAMMKAKSTPSELAQELNLIQSFDESYIRTSIQAVLLENPDKVKAYTKGKKALLSFFIGQVMRRTNGKANPKVTRETLLSLLDS
ncbi:MAG: Asp-tRNA(Asn)/Glu-tRNA(Gln) amidotransferase subunit GatB [Saprospiraceae bacterium]|nr:Asp-tRNA(Asn)/Glu-tRNA(Gln) amidotransferase subunit GatB [Saprospiraceae bacterium]